MLEGWEIRMTPASRNWGENVSFFALVGVYSEWDFLIRLFVDRMLFS